MDPEEFARAVERLSSDLSSLAFEQKQERLEWRHAMEAHSAEIQHLLERQDAMQIRQDELETLAIEIEDQLQGEARDLSARIQALSDRLDRLEQGQDRQASTLDDLRRDLMGLSRTTDEVFDDIADRVGVFEHTLEEFDRTLSKQYEVLTDRFQEARDQLTEGLAEALEAAEGHADSIIELKDAIATYQERRDELDTDSREQLATMRAQIAGHQESVSIAQEKLEQALGEHTAKQHAAVEGLETQLASGLAGAQEALGSLDSRVAQRLSTHEETLQQLNSGLSGRLAAQSEAMHRLEGVVAEARSRSEQELAALEQVVSQLAAQGQMLAQAIESVQQGSMKAEEQLGAALTEQYAALLRHLDSTSQAWQGSLEETQQQLKEFEAKVAKALGLQRGENLEHERHLTALRDDLTVLGNRVGTIVQLLTKANQPARSSLDPSAP